MSQALALLVVVAGPDIANAAGGGVAAKSVAADLRAGRAVAHTGIVVTGWLDLTGIKTVRSEFRCHNCLFRGTISASGVAFLNKVDMSGSVFEGRVDFQDATFKGAARFRQVRFRRLAEFSRATFQGLASFTGAVFERAAFREAQFPEVDFSATDFRGEAVFERAVFGREAIFVGAVFRGHASFRETDYGGSAGFAFVDFDGGADFSSARFGQGASFRTAAFVDLASLLSRPGSSFRGVTAERDLDFSFALFAGPLDSSVVADFADLICRQSLLLRDVAFRGQILVDRLDVRELVLDVDAVSHVVDGREQLAVLRKVQADAKTRGDFGLANDAFYEFHVVKSRDYSWPRRVLDVVFYRLVAGYLVRPSHPIALFVFLAFAASLFRVRRRDDNPDLTRRRRLTVPLRFLRRLAGEMEATMKDAVPHRFGGGGGTKIRGVELYAYRILLICALIGLYAQPTLRQYLDLVT